MTMDANQANKRTKHKGYILIVEDSPIDQQLLTRILTASGYNVRVASDGRSALSEAWTTSPDLILLDIMMPDMDGYEVCRQLKADPQSQTRDVPVIFISALDATFNKMEAFSVGGVDYITKPFDMGEIQSRVRSHLALRDMQKRLQEKNDQLQAENARRRQVEQTLHQKNEDLVQALQQLKIAQEELIQRAKMATLGQLITGIVHEIKAPLEVIRASANDICLSFNEVTQQLPQLLQQLPADKQRLFFTLLEQTAESDEPLFTKEEQECRRQLMRVLDEHNIEYASAQAKMLSDMGICNSDIALFMPLLQRHDALVITKVAYKLARQQKNSDNISLAVEHAIEILTALKNYTQPEKMGVKIKTDISQTLDTVLTIYYNQLQSGVEVFRYYEDTPAILCYPDDLNQVWANLIHNALQAMDYKGVLEIALELVDDEIVVQIIDDGPGIPEEIKERIFEPFFTTMETSAGTGLGLDIARQSIEKHKGKIEVESRPGKTVFTVRLPILE